MKRIFLVMLCCFLFFSAVPSFADRNVPTIAEHSASVLVKRGDWKLYRISFIATTNGGNFAIYDNTHSRVGNTIMAEGSEATSLNGDIYDFTGKPIEGSTGLYLVITTGTVIIEYE